MLSDNLNIALAFKNQVSKTPHQIAVYFDNLSLTFEELDLMSDRVAVYLLANNLSFSHIGISLPRSQEIPVAILGVLKAGCTYVFIDPDYPPERMKHILSDADIELMLCTSEISRSSFDEHIRKLPLSKVLKNSAKAEIQLQMIRPECAAYIMYTSATTGKPKGVVISHRNVLNYIETIGKLFNLKADDVYLHTASFSFSSSVRQFFVPLLNGIPVCIISSQDMLSLKRILSVILKYKVTIADTTQSLWKAGLIQIDRMESGEKSRLVDSSLRTIAFSGDFLPASLVQQIKKTLQKPVQFINICGQTEALGAMAYCLPPDFSQAKGYVPIGYPLENTQMFVVDDTMTPVPDGEIGEMVISSPSVGPGYYKNEELTARSFVADILSGNPDRRMLKTGDLVRFWYEKPAEMIGRKDFQVKIRGVRIDLNDIEAVLSGYPGVSDCHVASIFNHTDDLLLVAFVVASQDNTLHAEEVKRFLRTRLPANYVPEVILPIDKIPLTPNGKVDRKFLQEIAALKYEEKRDAYEVEFKNETQKSIYNMFVRVLNINNLSINDNFFDLGGHSLKAVELAEIMEKVFNRPVPAELIYQYPTVNKLALAVESIDSNSDSMNLVAIQPYGSKQPFICVHGDDSNYLFTKYLGDDIPFYGFFHQGRNGEKMKYTSIEDIANAYTEELFKLRPEGPYILAGYSIGGIIAFVMVNLIRARGGEVSKLILIDTLSPEYSGERIKGRYMFQYGQAEKEARSVRKPEANPGILHRLWTKFSLILFAAGYYLGLLFLLFGLRIPLGLRNSYIIGVYRRARSSYKPHGADVDTLLFRCTDDNFEDFDLGWERFIRGRLEINQVKSNHFSIIREPLLGEVAEIIVNRFYKNES